MWRDFGLAAGRVTLALLPLAVIFAVGYGWGWFRREVFALLGFALVLVTISHFVSVRFLGAEARDAVRALGPDATVPAIRPRRLSPGGWAIWPAALRLDRAWREHAASTAARLAAAEAVIGWAPDAPIPVDPPPPLRPAPPPPAWVVP